MATITLRVDDRTRDHVEALARARGLSVSELLRMSIDGMLGRSDARSSADVPTSLTVLDRWSLALQHEILARLDPSDSDAVAHHHHRFDVLRRGYTAEYRDEFESVEPELSLTDCALISDVLHMFLVLKASLERLDTDQVAALGPNAAIALSFHGFDAEDAYEARLLSYARFLTSSKHWEELAESFAAAHDFGNSGTACLPGYQRMLSAFRPSWKARRGRGPDLTSITLTPADLRMIVAAWNYPQRTPPRHSQ